MTDRHPGGSAPTGATAASDAPEIPADLRRLMAGVGPRWLADTAGNVKLMVAAFSEVHRVRRADPPVEVRDIPYAEHPRQMLDLYLPPRHAATSDGPLCPAVIFVHGGAFTEGHRNRTPEVYGNVARYFARHDIVGINMGYRLAPDSMFPGGTLDVAAAASWVRANAERYGIDPRRLFLMGHSAGGAHVASYAYDRRWQPPGGSGLAGLIVVSGRVRADNLPENTNARRVEEYYGTDNAAYDRMSGISHVAADSIPTFIAWAEYENKLIDVYCAELAWRIAAAKRRAPPVLALKGHNHTSIIAHLDTSEDRLGRALRDFIDDPR